jgi:hypothetical protein
MSNRYSQIIEHIFQKHFKEGLTEVAFSRENLVSVADELGIKLPKNIGDVVYSFRYRVPLPESIAQTSPPDKEWIIKGRGVGN